ncbi:hypothetical protein [Candidatus Villigracilis saccharophilus]|uniref:hypothetical protein n=1 Tax=Candidatus Villigracilis saccharophilus TaxID=3140684 RepID=UPI00313565F3|nr:hypothetical protein [Anaerolineales bacterium]
MFRFLKQHMGLNSNRSQSLVSAQQWMIFDVLWHIGNLLLLRDAVQEDYQPGIHRQTTARQG